MSVRRRAIAALVAWSLVVAATAARAEFKWTIDEKAGTALLTSDGKPVVEYMFAYDNSSKDRFTETYKPYHHVFGPGTGDRLTKGPGGTFPHHRGIYVAWNKTKTKDKSHDFWHCTNGDHERHIRFVEQEANADSAKMTTEIHWEDGDNKAVVTEFRTLKITKTPAGDGPSGWQIDWSTKLESNQGEITLTGDRQHAGMQFRADQSVADKNLARYIRPAGFSQDPKAIEENDGPAPPKHANLDWFAMTFPIKDHPYTVAYLQDPSLPKPSRFSERPYGRFGAFFETTLKPDQPLTMRYRLLVWPTDKRTSAEIQKDYDTFVAGLKDSTK